MNDMVGVVIALVAPGALGLAAFVAGGVWLMRSLHARARRRLAEAGAAVPMRCGSCGARFGMPAAAGEDAPPRALGPRLPRPVRRGESASGARPAAAG